MDKTENNAPNVAQQELIDQSETIEEIALRDVMTGLLSRRALEAAIYSRLEQMTDTDICAMFLINMDDFKGINDTHGSQMGDEMLARAAKVLSNLFRATDIVGRMEGDQFAVFLNGSLTEEMLRRKGQMICDQIQFIADSESETFATASVGIHMSKGRIKYEDLYGSAAQALDQVKKNGKQGYCIRGNGNGQEDAVLIGDEPVTAVRLRFLLDHIDSGVALTTAGSPMSLLYMSSTFVRMTGRDRKELFHTDFLSLIHPDDRQSFTEMLSLSETEEDDAANEIVRIQATEGKILWWRVHASRIKCEEKKVGMLLSVVDISEFKEKESSLQMDKNLFQAALDQTAQGIWEVNWKTRAFRMIGANDNFPEGLKGSAPFPEGLILQQWIHPECVDDFRRFASDMFDGRMQGYANFKVRLHKDETYSWVSFSYRLVLDEKGYPVRIVGIIEGLPQTRADHRRPAVCETLPESALSSLVFRMSGSLTLDTVENCWSEGKDITGEGMCRSCTEVLNTEVKKAYIPEKGERFSRFLSRDCLMMEYLEQDRRWIMHEYRRIDKSGQIRWVSCIIHLYQNEDDEEVMMSLWISNMESRQQWEAKYGLSVYKNAVTKMYTRSVMEEIVTRMMDERAHKKGALVLIWIGGMDRMYSRYSGNINMRMQALMIVLQLALGDGCIPGQFGMERCVLFFPEIKSEALLKKKLEQAFAFVRSITSDIVEGSLIRFMAAGISRYQDETDYTEMYKKIRVLSQLWGNITEDRVIFADEEQADQESLYIESESDRIRPIEEGTARPLSEQEKEAAFNCILEMLNTDTIKESAQCLLRFLGEHYDADRTYLLVTTEQDTVVSMPQEWTAAHKRSIQHVVSGTSIEKMPLLSHCVKEDRPVFLTRQSTREAAQMPGTEPAAEDAWRFAVFPMRDAGKIMAFLCIENARNEIIDAVMPMMLGTCLLKERRKCFYDTGTSADQRIVDANIPNHKAYMDTVVHYTSDVYSSLGVVTVDVPEYSMINGYQGFDSGRKLLWYVVQMITDVFGKTKMFRTWDAEFVVLCPNTTKQAFYGKCIRLRDALTRRYANEVRIGYTWSDRVFTGKKLVEDTKTIMRCSRPAKQHLEELYLPPAFAEYHTTGEMLNAGLFTIYFQPKIDMRDGSLVGAEVLVRGVDQDGRAIAPVQFLDVFGKNGSIRDLDLYVFDRALRTLDQWREAGMQMIPLSVNFASATLYDAHIKASILAIQSRYPDLDPGLIEVEVRECTDAASRKRTTDAIRAVRQYGVAFSMDDFGVRQADLSVLVELPLDAITLDRALISDIAESDNSRMLVRDIADICRRKQIRCIAKGVETAEQAEILSEAGCRYAQGFYYDRPLPEDIFVTRYLKKKNDSEADVYIGEEKNVDE